MIFRPPASGRGLQAALGSVILGVLLLAGSAYALRGPILESYYLKRLASKESPEREAAARELAKHRSRRAAEPILRLYLEAEIRQATRHNRRDPAEPNPYLDPLNDLGCLAIPALWKERSAEADGVGRQFDRRVSKVHGLLYKTLEQVSGVEVASDTRLRAAIVEALGDPAHEVRWQAARALGRTAQLPPEAVPLLKGLLEDGSGDVRRAAAQVLESRTDSVVR